MIKKYREFCFKEQCSYRTSTKDGKAFCMFPRCPYGRSYYIDDKGKTYNEQQLRELLNLKRKARNKMQH